MPRVVDAILFNGENDLLEIRLNELNPVVDYFVVVESKEAHGSNSSHFETRVNIPAAFAEKVAYECLEKLEPEYTDGQSGWARENFHRNALMGPVSKLVGPDDIVIVSDADEIPRAQAIRRYLSGPPPGVTLLRLDHYFYNVNCYAGIWMRSSIGTLKAYQDMGGFQAPRGHLGDVIERHVTALAGAGWHFSSFFSVPRLREKLQNFAHSFEMEKILALSDEEITVAIKARRNIFTGAQLARRFTKNPSLPNYLLSNLKRFEQFTEEGQFATTSQLV